MRLDKEKLDKIIFLSIKNGVYLILFLPLVVVSHFFFPFIGPKNVFFRILVEILLFLYVLLAVRDERYRPKFNFLTLLVAIYFLIVTITSFTGIGLYRSAWGNYERMGGFFMMWHVFAFFMILISVFKDKKDWHSFFTMSILASMVMSFFGLAQRFNIDFILESSGGSRLTGTIGNATYLAAYLLINLFFILYFIFKDKDFDLKLFLKSIIVLDVLLIIYDFFIARQGILSQLSGAKNLFLVILVFQGLVVAAWFLRHIKYAVKGLLVILFIFEFTILFWTQTRGAIVGMFISLVMLAAAGAIFSQNKIIKRSFYSFLAVLVIIPIILFANRNSDFVQKSSTLSRLASISYEDITTQTRTLTWKASFKGWTENPVRFLFGYGQEHYAHVFNKHFPPEIFKDLGSQIWFDRAHNIIFDVGITAGFIGLLAYLGILALAFYYLFVLFKRKKDFILSFVLMALLLAYFGQNFFVFDTIDTYILFYLIIGFVVFLGGNESGRLEVIAEKAKRIFLKIKPKKINYIHVYGTGILVVVLIYGFNIRLLRANNLVYQALKPSATATLQDRYDYFKKSLAMGVTGRYETRQQIAAYTQSLLRSNNFNPDITKKWVDFSAEELEKSVAQEPISVRHYLFLGGFYNNISYYYPFYADKAIVVLKEGLPLSPTRPQMYFELGRAYFAKNNFNEGLAYFEKGIDLAPKVVESRLDLLIAYAIAQKFEDAQREYLILRDELGGLHEPRYLRIISTFENIGRYDVAVSVYQDMIKIYPDNPSHYIGLAKDFAALGQNDKAEVAMKKAVELNPGYSSEAEKFYQELKEGKLKK